MRKSKSYKLNSVISPTDFPEFDTVLFMNSNGQGRNLLALGKKNEYMARGGYSVLNVLNHCTLDHHNDWLFGYLSYDLKNYIEDLQSSNFDGVGFPLFHFWQPRIVLEWTNEELTAHWIILEENEVDQLAEKLMNHQESMSASVNISLQSRISREQYLEAVQNIKAHIHQGDIYELNFCQEFYSENTTIDTWDVYQHLNNATEAPYSAYLRDREFAAMSASPELYLKKRGNTLSTSPIKGTARRESDPVLDEQQLEKLKLDPKEKSENIMIVDLVRNDLSRVADQGSVQVDELMDIISLKTVHQMVSTVSCKLKQDTTFRQIVESTFPMGSMTGAPKISAMQLSEKYESTKRGLYSGSIGFFEPNGDFQFNVMIRSLLYNRDNQYLSLMTGGALTDKCIPEQEYDESLLKAEAIVRALKS